MTKRTLLKKSTIAMMTTMSLVLAGCATTGRVEPEVETSTETEDSSTEETAAESDTTEEETAPYGTEDDSGEETGNTENTYNANETGDTEDTESVEDDVGGETEDGSDEVASDDTEATAEESDGTSAKEETTTAPETTVAPTQATAPTQTAAPTPVPTQAPAPTATPTPTKPPAPTATPVPTATPTPSPTPVPQKSLKELAMEAFEIQNQYRIEAGVQPLIWDEKLYELACIRAEEISVEFSHDKSFLNAGENIYGGGWIDNFLPELAMRSWKESPGHYRTLTGVNSRYGAIAFYSSGPYETAYGAALFQSEFMKECAEEEGYYIRYADYMG